MTDSPLSPALVALFQGAVHAHQAGDLRRAEQLYREVLRHAPGWVEPRRLLGLVAINAGKFGEGIEALRLLSQEVPQHPDVWHDLGDACLASGQNSEAVQSYRQLLGLDGGRADARVNLGLALYRDGRTADAVVEYRAAIRCHPEHSAAHFNLGLALEAIGDLDAAATAYDAAARTAAEPGPALFNLGCVRLAQRATTGAIEAFTRAVQARPEHAASHANLGKALLDQHQPAKAVIELRRAVELESGLHEAWVMLIAAHRQAGALAEALRTAEHAARRGIRTAALLNNHAAVLQDVGRAAECEALCRSALELEPDFAEAHDNLGTALLTLRRFDEAAACFVKALELNPGLTKSRENMAIYHRDKGQLDQAEACLREAIARDPGSVSTRSALLFVLQLSGRLSAEALFAEHRAYGEAVEACTALPAVRSARVDRKKLRIGYVSGDFRTHSVAYFFEPLLTHHDRSRFEIACYYSNGRSDAVTQRIRAQSDLWVECVGQSDEALAERIHADGIDILVDLSGHTGNNRLPAFALKPAPVQMTWLGYSDTTGMKRMDFRITDCFVSPEGRFERWHTEKLLRLPNAFLCYAPPDDAPSVARAPSAEAGHVTFGCFNFLGKVSDEILLAWAEILRRSPSARLLLKNKSLGDQGTRSALQARVARCGIPSERLLLQAYEPDLKSHLEHYGRVDVALDSFPYAGGTTTCEALWMGVPVISLVGDSYVSRMGLSLLTNAGHPEWAAHSVDDYIDTALTVAESATELYRMREAQRERLSAQPLFRPAQFARDMEDAYESAWAAR